VVDFAAVLGAAFEAEGVAAEGGDGDFFVEVGAVFEAEDVADFVDDDGVKSSTWSGEKVWMTVPGKGLQTTRRMMSWGLRRPW